MFIGKQDTIEYTKDVRNQQQENTLQSSSNPPYWLESFHTDRSLNNSQPKALEEAILYPFQRQPLEGY